MKICINYYGLPRNVERALRTFRDAIEVGGHEFHIVYTTWTVEYTRAFETAFPQAFVRKIRVPDETVFGDLLSYELDWTNTQKGKRLRSYLLGSYAKQESKNTILEYEKNHNIKFDIIVTLRTDTVIEGAHLADFYGSVELERPIMYFASEPTFDEIHKEGAVPDALQFSGRDFHLKTLDILAILPNCTLKGQRVFHGETCCYKQILYHGGAVNYLPFYAFIQPRSK